MREFQNWRTVKERARNNLSMFINISEYVLEILEFNHRIFATKLLFKLIWFIYSLTVCINNWFLVRNDS